MDDFLSAAADSVVCNTFPRPKVVNLKAKKGLQVELSKASCHALQPAINCGAADCDKQDQAQDASSGDQTHRVTCKHCLCR